MASFRTGYEGLAGAVQGAFDTYYRRKEGRKGREFAGEQAGLDREARMKELQKRIDSAEQEGDLDRANRLKIEREAIIAGKYEHDPSMAALKGSLLTQDRERRLKVLQERIERQVKQAMTKATEEIESNEKWTYKKLSEFEEIPAFTVEDWQQKNMTADRDLAYDFIRAQITDHYINLALSDPGNTEYLRADFVPYFEANKFLTMEANWDQEKYDVEPPPKSLTNLGQFLKEGPGALGGGGADPYGVTYDVFGGLSELGKEPKQELDLSGINEAYAGETPEEKRRRLEEERKAKQEFRIPLL